MTTKKAVLEAHYRGPVAEFVRVFHVPWDHRELAGKALLGSPFTEKKPNGEQVVSWPDHLCWRVVTRGSVEES